MEKHFEFINISLNSIDTPVLQLKNQSEFDNWVIEKSKTLINENTYTKDNCLKLLDEINSICKQELTGSIPMTFDINLIKNNIGFDINEIKKQIIYSYNYIQIIGNIIFLTFDLPGFRLNYIEESSPAPFSTSDIAKTAYSEIIICKQLHNKNPEKTTHAYGATFLLLSLIECELKLHIKKHYIHKYLDIIENNKSLSLNVEDTDYINYLKYLLEISDSYTGQAKFDPTSAQNQLFYAFLHKHNLEVDSTSDLEKLYNINNPFTLNQLIQSDLFKNIADIRFHTGLSNIFGRNKLNLRNQIAHMKKQYFNYFAISNTMLLYYLFLIISCEWWKKD